MLTRNTNELRLPSSQHNPKAEAEDERPSSKFENAHFLPLDYLDLRQMIVTIFLQYPLRVESNGMDSSPPSASKSARLELRDNQSQ